LTSSVVNHGAAMPALLHSSGQEVACMNLLVALEMTLRRVVGGIGDR
jgi:hypothetical protein